MKLCIRQKPISLTDRFTVRGEDGLGRWAVEGELFSLGHRLHVYGPDGTEAAMLQQKLLSFLPSYLIYRGGSEVARLIKDFTFFSQHYRLEGVPWTLSGDFFCHDYTLQDDTGRILMTITKEWFTWGDSYVLTIDDSVDELLCLCIVLGVDCANASSQNSAV